MLTECKHAVGAICKYKDVVCDVLDLQNTSLALLDAFNHLRWKTCKGENKSTNSLHTKNLPQSIQKGSKQPWSVS